ncbi:MAG TPA: hypothetical protein ENI76_06790 [Ignavibacteria bacterium]|nr:hypothetical protein [Ignavibacteria bacterium]
MKRIAIVFILMLVGFSFTMAQVNAHRWLPLQNKQAKRIWYDAAMIDNATGNDTFDIWVLEQHTPPLIFKEVKGKVYRSKILYSINLKTVKYGIMKVVYYNSANKKLYSFNYPIANFPDKYKYTYPIMKDNYLYNIIKEYIKAEKKNKQKRYEKTK